MHRLPRAKPFFQRRPNFDTDQSTPPALRENIAHNFKLLEDPQTGRELLLIGTMNASPVMAQKTLAVLNKFQPDTMVVQTTPDWHETIKRYNGGRTNLSQEEIFKTPYSYLQYKTERNIRGLVTNFRFWSWYYILNNIIAVRNKSANMNKPGVEVFKAIELAKQKNVELVYTGFEFNPTIVAALEQENRFKVLHFFKNFFFGRNSHWADEAWDFKHSFASRGFEAWSENVDDKTLLWLRAYLNELAPHHKKIMVDFVDEELFRTIWTNKSKRLVALVNQIHVPGIEFFWKDSVRADVEPEINPIGDYDISEAKRIANANNALQRFASKIGKTEPATNSIILTQYVKQTTEWERERHAFFRGYNDPELEHALYNGENEKVANMPYKVEHH